MSDQQSNGSRKRLRITVVTTALEMSMFNKASLIAFAHVQLLYE
jgi:hypothetical protein